MKVYDTLVKMLRDCPTLYTNRVQALDQLFCVVGNGYEWVSGELVEKSHLSEHKLERPCSPEELKKLETIARSPDFSDAMLGMKHEFYPLSERSALLNLPADVKYDWFKAAQECFRYINTQVPELHVTKTSEENHKWLKKVKWPKLEFHYSGNLEYYFETGFEGEAAILHDNRGDHQAPSFNNETKKWDGPPMTYKSLAWAHFFRGGEHLEVFDPDGKTLWSGVITKDRVKMAELEYRLHFIPKEIKFEDWLRWCRRKYRAKAIVDRPVAAEDPSENWRCA